MKSWSSAIFPLVVLLALAGLTFWLRHAIELPNERRDGKYRHDPDYIVEQPRLRKLDAAGHLQYTLSANEIRHFPDNDTTNVNQPKLVYLPPDKPTVAISSERAYVSQNGQQVEFLDNVRIERAATAMQAPLLVTMRNLTVRPDDEKAYTRSPVQITQGQSWLNGVGMQVDHAAQTYLLESQVVGQFESKFSKRR